MIFDAWCRARAFLLFRSFALREMSKEEREATRRWCFLMLLGLAQINSKLQVFSSEIDKERERKIDKTRMGDERLKLNYSETIITYPLPLLPPLSRPTRTLQKPLDITTCPCCCSRRVSEIVQIYIYIYIYICCVYLTLIIS